MPIHISNLKVIIPDQLCIIHMVHVPFIIREMVLTQCLPHILIIHILLESVCLLLHLIQMII